MVENALTWAAEGAELRRSFAQRFNDKSMEPVRFIMVDDLNHLVKGGQRQWRSYFGKSPKYQASPVFNDAGVIEVFEKIPDERKRLRD